MIAGNISTYNPKYFLNFLFFIFFFRFLPNILCAFYSFSIYFDTFLFNNLNLTLDTAKLNFRYKCRKIVLISEKYRNFGNMNLLGNNCIVVMKSSLLKTVLK